MEEEIIKKIEDLTGELHRLSEIWDGLCKMRSGTDSARGRGAVKDRLQEGMEPEIRSL